MSAKGRVIAIELAKFVSKDGPPSLDGSPQDNFVRKVLCCSHLLYLLFPFLQLGVSILFFITRGPLSWLHRRYINEWYTSQRCLDCDDVWTYILQPERAIARTRDLHGLWHWDFQLTIFTPPDLHLQ